MTKKELIKIIRNNRLYAVINEASTNRVLKIRFMYIKNNKLYYICNGDFYSKLYKSGAIGMDRVFDCWLKLLKDFDIEQGELGNCQNWIVIGE